MQGPYNLGTFGSLPTPSEGGWERGRLARGQTYRVVKAFHDADGQEHLVGEEWLFLGAMFNKFDDELAICIRLVGGEEWKIPLIWSEDEQGDTLENWQNYVMRI